MGCAVACVASQCGLDYTQALRLFEQEKYAWTRGFYCTEVVEAFAKAGRKYDFAVFRASKHREILEVPGTVLFLDPSDQYPSGHYVLRIEDGWMNPWVNFPQMNPVRAAVVHELAGKVGYVVFPKK